MNKQKARELKIIKNINNRFKEESSLMSEYTFEEQRIIIAIKETRIDALKEEIAFLIDLKHNYNHAGESYRYIENRIIDLKEEIENGNWI